MCTFLSFYLPTKSTLSPGCALSTVSALRIISKLLGMLPRGNSLWISWMRTFWKSTNRDLLTSNVNLERLLQTGFRQIEGWVYLNCCSTSGIEVWQSAQMNVPRTNSGWTGWVLTTWPVILTSAPIRALEWKKNI